MTFDYAKEETPNGMTISSGLIDINGSVCDSHFSALELVYFS